MSQDQEQDFAPEMFDATAQVRPLEEHDPAELSRMSPERKIIFDNLHAALANERAKENAKKDAMQDIKKAQAVAELKEIALEKLSPKRGFHSVWQTDIAKQAANPNDNTDEIKAARADLEAAHEAVQICQQAYTTASNAVQPARALVANALKHYTSRFPVLTAAQAYKQHIDSLQKSKLEAKQNYEQVERTVASVLDSHLQSGRGSPGIRSTRQAQRNPITPGSGTYPASMQGRVIAQQTDPRAPIDNRGTKRH